MMKKQLFRSVAAAAMLTLAAPAALAADPPIKVSSPQAAKGASTIAIGAFTIGFIFESVDNGKATGGLIGAFGGATKAKSVLEGVDAATMQAITDAAYEDFVTQLTARGYTVTAPDALFSHAAFAKVKTVASPYEASVALEKNSKGKVSYYKPSALPGLMLLPGDIMMGGFGGIGMNMTMGQNAYNLTTYTKESGQSVVDVVYLIDFSQLKRPGAFSFGGLQVNSGMAVVDEYSKLSLISPAGKTASLLIKQPVAVEGDFATREDTTKDGALQSAANVAGGVAAVFGMGGMKFGKSKTFTFTAKPAYREGAIKAATLANERLVTQLAALR